jgi:hypothetical protein
MMVEVALFLFWVEVVCDTGEIGFALGLMWSSIPADT